MLDDRIIPLDLARGRERASLPEVLAALVRDEVEGFPDLLAYQRHGWFLFLAQTSTIALERAGLDRPPVDAASWRELLLALTDGRPEPWRLVVPDLTKPAFLQPPLPSGELAGHQLLANEPDGIDVLVTAKAHDVKPLRIGTAEPHHWLYAILTLQTMQGYSGKLNYGIARMNGGFASRPLVELTPSRRWGSRFLRALRVARRARNRILARHPDYYHGDLALLWLVDWAEERSLSLRDLDPFFVEICRRVRLVEDPAGRISAWGRTSTVPRVEAKDAAGVLGDPWLPVLDNKALTVAPNGFHYARVVEILTEANRPMALELFDDDPPDRLWLHLAVLVRGQGETGGVHERWLPVPGRGGEGDWFGIGDIGELMVADAGHARQALRSALTLYLQGGPDEPDWREERAREAAAMLDRRIDRELFFLHLWDLAKVKANDTAYGEAMAIWRQALCGLVREEFATAVVALPAPENRKERAHAKAANMLDGLLRKYGLMATRTEEVTA